MKSISCNAIENILWTKSRIVPRLFDEKQKLKFLTSHIFIFHGFSIKMYVGKTSKGVSLKFFKSHERNKRNIVEKISLSDSSSALIIICVKDTVTYQGQRQNNQHPFS